MTPSAEFVTDYKQSFSRCMPRRCRTRASNLGQPLSRLGCSAPRPVHACSKATSSHTYVCLAGLEGLTGTSLPNGPPSFLIAVWRCEILNSLKMLASSSCSSFQLRGWQHKGLKPRGGNTKACGGGGETKQKMPATNV